MHIDEIEKMISYQKKTIQNASRISKDFKSGYMAALNTLSASIEAVKEPLSDDPFLKKIV